jgi:hypothetical protein
MKHLLVVLVAVSLMGAIGCRSPHGGFGDLQFDIEKRTEALADPDPGPEALENPPGTMFTRGLSSVVSPILNLFGLFDNVHFRLRLLWWGEECDCGEEEPTP